MENTANFARETGELTVERWKIGVTLYLLFALAGAVAEWLYYPERALLLVAGYACQVLLVAIIWRLLSRRGAHPATAWPAMWGMVTICMIVAGYNAMVGGDLLYVLLMYILFMLVAAVFMPWGADFQLRLDVGIIGAYTLGVLGQARVGPSPAYDYLYIVAATVFSTLGAWYIDTYRCRLYAQAEELREANRRLEAANQARNDLLSGLSHDMRTPLAVLIGYTDMLAETAGLAESARMPVRSIRREARELLRLVDGVLDLARIEGGRLPFQRSMFGLAEALDPLRETTLDMLDGRDVRLEWAVPASLTLDSDADKVREIVRNLLSNAVKYTERGRITLKAATDQAAVVITVSDTGVGIASDHLDDIFDPFRQVHPGAGAAESGAGFGLYLVKLLVNLIGGRIEVESRPGIGSTFQVWIPPWPPA